MNEYFFSIILIILSITICSVFFVLRNRLKREDGTMRIREDEGKIIFDLELSGHPMELLNKEFVIFRVEKL